MANAMEYELPPLQRGKPWKHAPNPKLGSARYAPLCEKLDQVLDENAAPINLNADPNTITFTPFCSSC